MAIDNEILMQIKIDFYALGDSHNFDIEYDDRFWDWFLENANAYQVCQDCDSLFPDFQNLPANCFGNSKRFAIMGGIDYCEGFVQINNQYIFHGFNFLYDFILDCTIHSNPNLFTDERGRLPNQYYGLKIPNNIFENELNAGLIANPVNLPFEIYNYFLIQTG